MNLVSWRDETAELGITPFVTVAAPASCTKLFANGIVPEVPLRTVEAADGPPSPVDICGPVDLVVELAMACAEKSPAALATGVEGIVLIDGSVEGGIVDDGAVDEGTACTPAPSAG